MTGYESKKAAAQDKMVVTDLDGHVVRGVRKPKKAAARDKLKCQCSMTTSLVGSGCQYCNPEYMDDETQPAQEPDWKALVLEHNADCDSRCDMDACGYKGHFEFSNRRCPTCPVKQKIDVNYATQPAQEPMAWGASALSKPEYIAEQKEKTSQLRNMMDEAVQTVPNFDQLQQIVNNLEHCLIRDSKHEFLRVWIRDWTEHKLSKHTPPQRTWVGLTDEETSGFTQHEMAVVKYVSKVLQEKNNGT